MVEGSFYLSSEYKLGWNHDIAVVGPHPNVTNSYSISFTNFSCNLFKWKIENVSDCIKKIFVSTKDFVQLFMDRRQFVFDFMDFLIKNHGTNNMILAVNSYSGKTVHGHHDHCSKMLAAFEEKYSYLFRMQDLKYFKTVKTGMNLNSNDDQGRVPCSTIIFSNSGKIEIEDTMMDRIDSYLTRGYSDELCLKQSNVTNPTKDDRFDILAEQIFQLYWLKKSVKNEINYLNFKKKSKLPIVLAEEEDKKLKVYDQEIKKLWNQTISRCSEILEGSTKTESDLIAELSPHLLFALRNELVTKSAYNSEQISKLKLLDDDFDENEDMEDSEEEETTPGSNESQTTSSFGSEKSDKIISRKRKQDLSENLCSESTITMNNKDYRSLQSEMAQLLKMTILLSNDALQPFVKTQDSNERVLLGFASHQNRTKLKKTETSEMFVSPCPKECSIDDRQWICINCGEFFKIQGFQVVCSCGTTHVTNLKLECFDPKHPKDFFPCEKHDPTSASISSSRRSSFSVIEDAQ